MANKVFTTPELEAFLREKRVWTKYKANCLRYGSFSEEERPYRNLEHSFVWTETPEGHSFWGKLSTEFNERIENG